MPSDLGIGGSTPYEMKSNHKTALNHSFRSGSSFNAKAQTRVKCHFCGCWATKGKRCYHCQRPQGRYVPPRNNNVKVEPNVEFSLKSKLPTPQHQQQHIDPVKNIVDAPADKGKSAPPKKFAPRTAASNSMHV